MLEMAENGNLKHLISYDRNFSGGFYFTKVLLVNEM